jgi:hypothetical protein
MAIHRRQAAISTIAATYCAMPRGLVIAVAVWLASLLTAESTASAHDWYPFECCAEQDCMKASAVVLNGLTGKRTVIVGDRHIEIPDNFARRTSPDGAIHFCLHTSIDEMDGSTILIPICLFMPPES